MAVKWYTRRLETQVETYYRESKKLDKNASQSVQLD